MLRTFLAIILTIAAFIAVGCNAAQQGQGETRLTTIQGVYAEHVVVNFPPESTDKDGYSFKFFDEFGSDSGDQDISSQPVAEGTARNDPSTSVETEVQVGQNEGSGAGVGDPAGDTVEE